MKKTRVAILFLLLTLFAACLPAAAELPAQIDWPCRGIDRTHNLIGYVELGDIHLGRYQCTHCGYYRTPYHPYEGHSGGTETPTCTTGKTCALCGAEYGILGHDWGAWTPIYDGTTYTHARSCKNCPEVDTANCTGGTATCSAKAVCEVCGGKYGERNPNNHDLVHHDAKAATCTEKGWKAYDTCSRCNYTTYVELPAQHAFVYHQAKPATCKEIGWDAYKTCSRCDYTNYQEIPTLNHDLRQYVMKAPTCKEIGFASITCWRCDYYASQVLSALNHDLKQYAAKAPTCTEKGWNAYEACSRSGCDYTTYVELPAQHDLVHHDAQAATCTAIGWDAYDTCSRCDHTTYQEIPALKHDLVQHAAQAPTCTGIGWDAYETCSRCDHTTYPELPALNHDLEQHAAQAPTCTEKGWNAYETCSRCDYTTYAEQPALNHDLERHAAKAPTCTEKGWNAYETCSRCDHTTYAEQPALNHDLVRHAAKAATCTEIGWDAYDTCSRCDYTTYAELPILGHDYQAVIVEPTCETDGYTLFTCSRCKDSYTANPTDKLGHQFDAWSPNETGSQSAGCLRQGCVHIGSTDCRKFTFRTAEGGTLTFCPVCGQAENTAQLEKLDDATAWALSGSLSAEDVTARTNGEYLSVAFETAGSLTQPTGLVRLALPAGLLEGKKLVRIAPDGTQTELPFEARDGKLLYTLDFAESELPVMLFRLVPQTTTL